MSRHRNVRNLIAEDDYYDDDYDDYDDDYDDYGDSSYSKPKAAPTTTSNSKGGANTNKNQKQQQQQQQPQHKKPVAKPSTAASKPPATTTKPPATATKPAVSATAAASISQIALPPPAPPPAAKIEKPTSAGIVLPPPGWGKPQEIPPGPTPTTDSPAATQQQQQPVPPVLQELFLQNKQSSESQLSLVVIGHVDAGKSTLLGHLLYQAGLVSKRQAQKLLETTGGGTGTRSDNNNSNNHIPWAWFLDEDENERSRGVTMNLATKTLSTPHHPHLVLVDAPGHADFVPTMITGAAHADAALLVVDASSESAFQAAFARGGQTKEHLLLARGLGVSQLVVCINKLDVPQWSQHVFDDLQQRLWPFLTQRAGFAPPRIRFVPTSGLTGVNIMNHTTTNNNNNSPATPILLPPALTQWYKGPSLYEMIDTFQPVKKANLGTYVFHRSDPSSAGPSIIRKARLPTSAPVFHLLIDISSFLDHSFVFHEIDRSIHPSIRPSL